MDKRKEFDAENTEKTIDQMNQQDVVSDEPVFETEDEPVKNEAETDLSDETAELSEQTDLEDHIDENTENDSLTAASDEESFIVNQTEGAKKSKKKIAMMASGIVAAILLFTYGAGCVFYSWHFFGRSTINGREVSNQSVETVVGNLKSIEKDYELKLKKRAGQQATIKGSAIDFKYNDDGEVEKILDSQSCWKWPVSFFSDTKYSGKIPYSYDKTKLNKVITDLKIIDESVNVAPENAHPAYENGKIVIKPEVYGSKVDATKLNQEIEKTIADGKEELDLEKTGCYETPKYKSDAPEVKNAQQEMEKCCQAEIVYTIDDAREVLNASIFGSWLGVDENMKVTVNEEQAAGYLGGLAERYNTSGGTYQFTNSYGSTISIGGGTLGWRLDIDGELPEMIDSIKSGAQISKEPANNGASRSNGTHTVGNNYVEISIDNQTVWLYVNGNCILSTPTVTGCAATGHDTPRGVFSIMYHARDVSLQGYNDDGSQYNSPVRYWMPFCGDDGMHDADWRSEFGGSIYQYNGSHGCVNLPISAAETIFYNTTDGFPVVVW